MGFIDTNLAKTHFKHKKRSDEILNDLGRKLPKKVPKKLRWKKIRPILSLLMAVLTHLTGARSGQDEARPGAPAPERVSAPPSGRPPATSKKLSDETLRASVERAWAYQAEIDRLAQNASDAAHQNRVRELAAHVRTWTGSIADLAQRIENFRQNKLIGKDLKEVPKSITTLEPRLEGENDPVIRGELKRTLTSRRQQLAALEKLQRSTRLAEIKMESTLSMLGAIYSQILAGQSTRQVADYRRLLDEIDEEVHTLQDQLEALE